MKKIALFISLTFFVILSLFSGNIEYQIDINSNYIWRGFDLNPSHKLVVQPSVTLSVGSSGFGLNIWSSFSFENKRANELDFTLFYNFKTGEDFTLSAGFIHYGWYFIKDFKFKDNTTQEVYVSIGFPNFLFSPEVSIYYDFNNGKGLYILSSLGYSLKLSDEYVADISASVGYNGGQWIDKSGLSDINFSLAIPLKFGKIDLTPSVNYTFVLLNQVSVDNHFWVGVSVVF